MLSCKYSSSPRAAAPCAPPDLAKILSGIPSHPASRSLRQVTAEELQQMITRIVGERIADGQLDESPLTLEEITRIRNSFQFTLLNMLHARVAYPEAPGAPGTAAKA